MPHKRKDLKIEGANLWYFVGLITTDGCLSSDGRHINITSKDHSFLDNLRMSLGITNKIGTKYNASMQKSFQIHIGNKNFYEFLLSIGLMPNKSLILGQIKVPDNYFCDFLRGVVDGDGCIRKWTHSTNKREQWSLRIYSGSKKFVDWLNESITQLFRVTGKIHTGKNISVLKYGKMASRKISEECYYKNCFGLDRKIKLAQECIKSTVGWTQSKTVLQ
jgi:hypothetical protein